MTIRQKENIKSLIRYRKTAGEKLMEYDSKLQKAFEELGVDFVSIECGINSVFLITEPVMCEQKALELLDEIEKGGDE